MFDRRYELALALGGLLLACGQNSESGQNSVAGASGAATNGSWTGDGGRSSTQSTTENPTGGTTEPGTAISTNGGSANVTDGTGGATGAVVASGGAQTSNSIPANGGRGPTSNTQSNPSLGGSHATSSTKSSSSGGAGGTSSTKSSSAGGAGGTSSAKSSAVAGGAGGGSSTKTTAVTGGTTGTAGAPSAGSKRGIAANIAPGAAFFPAVAWWYNWAIKSSGANVGIEFVPMVWNQTTVSSAIPSGSKYLLGFNEPNFFAQANLSPTDAASYWPKLQTNANSAGVAIVGPGMNFCGPADQCHGTDPYKYLQDFFAACTNCQVDYVAVHWYNCDLPSLRDYLEPGGNLAGFEQFGKPIWLTEFSCDGSASVAQQEAFMREAIPYLENNPKVFRYSWFSADPIPNAKLINSDGTPTALGKVYISLPHGS